MWFLRSFVKYVNLDFSILAMSDVCSSEWSHRACQSSCVLIAAMMDDGLTVVMMNDTDSHTSCILMVKDKNNHQKTINQNVW